MARPVIASAVGDGQTLIKEGENGCFLFPPGNLAGLKGALQQAFLARRQLQKLGKAAREEVVANHSWNARIHFMAEHTEKILGNSR